MVLGTIVGSGTVADAAVTLIGPCETGHVLARAADLDPPRDLRLRAAGRDGTYRHIGRDAFDTAASSDLLASVPRDRCADRPLRARRDHLLPLSAAGAGRHRHDRDRWWRPAELAGSIVAILVLYFTWGAMLGLLEELLNGGPIWVFAPLAALLFLPALIEAKPFIE